MYLYRFQADLIAPPLPPSSDCPIAHPIRYTRENHRHAPRGTIADAPAFHRYGCPCLLHRNAGTTLTFSERFHEIRTGFERPFWVANISELFERLSYYAAFASLPRYLHESLNFGVERASSLAGLFGGLVWFLAAFGGALADRMGFRRALSLAYLILAVSYFLLGSIGSPWLAPIRNAMPLVVLVTLILMLPALGIALVKPSRRRHHGTRFQRKRALDRLLHLLHRGEHRRSAGAVPCRMGAPASQRG